MLGFIKNLVGGLALISFTVAGGIANSILYKTDGILKYGVKAEPPTYDMHDKFICCNAFCCPALFYIINI